VTLDFADDPVVLLATGNMFQSVQASFTKDQADITAALRKGQSVVVECARLSEVAGTPMLGDCTLPAVE
jgi:hypothetical protein